LYCLSVVCRDVLNAWVHNVRDDGKVDLGLRPAGRGRVTVAQESILAALEQPSNEGRVPVGDKSDPMLIRRFFPGVSKKQFKEAVGALFRQGIVRPSRTELVLVPESERAAVAAEVASRKTGGGGASGAMSVVSGASAPGEARRGEGGGRIARDPRVKTARVAPGVDAVLVSGLNYKTTAEALVRFLERGMMDNGGAAAYRVLRVGEMVGKDGRPSGRAVVTFKPIPPRPHAPQSSQASISAATKTSSASAPTEKKKKSPLTDDDIFEMPTTAATAAVSAKAMAAKQEAEASAALFAELGSCKVPELKERLKEQGLRVSGLKAELIERLVEHHATSVKAANEAAASESDGVEDVFKDEEEDTYGDDDDLPGVVLSPAPVAPSSSLSSSAAAGGSGEGLEEKEALEAMQRVVSAACLLDGAPLNGRDLRIRPYYPERPRAKKSSSSRWDEEEDDEEDYDDDEEEEEEWGSAAVRANEPSSKSEGREGFRGEEYRNARRLGRSVPSGSEKGARGGVRGREGKQSRGEDKKPPCAFFGNLPYGQDMQALGEEIEAVCGQGSVVEIRPSPYGDYAHVDFASPQAAQVAVRELNNFPLRNRPLRVDLAR
jgi:hypothetical protein